MLRRSQDDRTQQNTLLRPWTTGTLCTVSNMLFLNVRKCEQFLKLQVEPHHSFWESENFDFEKVDSSLAIVTPKVATELQKIEEMSQLQNEFIEQLVQDEADPNEFFDWTTPVSSPCSVALVCAAPSIHLSLPVVNEDGNQSTIAIVTPQDSIVERKRQRTPTT